MTTTATIELTDRQIAHRKACAALKSVLKELAATQVELKRDHKEALREGRWMDTHYGAIESNKDDITSLHVIHNRIRHKRPHLGTLEKDEDWVSSQSAPVRLLARMLGEEDAKAVEEVL